MLRLAWQDIGEPIHAGSRSARRGPARMVRCFGISRRRRTGVPRARRRLLAPGRPAQLAQPGLEQRASPTKTDRRPNPRRAGAAPTGTRPRDLRSSYITLRVYEGVPLTSISREVGTSVRMIENERCRRSTKSVPRAHLMDAQWTSGTARVVLLLPRNPCKAAKADARTRTGDPSLRVRDLLSMAMGFSPFAATLSPRWRPCFLPAGGHESPHRQGWVPLVATNLPSDVIILRSGA